MIIQFSVENFKSFKTLNTLDMQAAEISEHTDCLIKDKDEYFLPLAVIYGPNGGGKSNILKALKNLVSRVLTPVCSICGEKRCNSRYDSELSVPFKFDDISVTLPTKYELYFRTEKYEYCYKLNVKEEKVLFESLTYIKPPYDSKPLEIFLKDVNNGIQRASGKLNGINMKNVKDTLPLLSYFGIIKGDNEFIKDVLDFFHKFQFMNYGENKNIGIPVIENKNVKELMLTMLDCMDIDIIDYDYEVDKTTNEIIDLYTFHEIDNKRKVLNIHEESNGTIKIFQIIPFIAECILHGGILVIDELDAKLHPKLLQYIINLFRDMDFNKNESQLIFTSHDMTSMTSEFFRRDEVWFAAKNEHQESKLYSLVEIKRTDGKNTRKDEKYSKRYLEGKYGADPYLKKMLDWEVK